MKSPITQMTEGVGVGCDLRQGLSGTIAGRDQTLPLSPESVQSVQSVVYTFPSALLF